MDLGLAAKSLKPVCLTALALPGHSAHLIAPTPSFRTVDFWESTDCIVEGFTIVGSV